LRDSFRYAFHGIRHLCREERNFRIHLIVAGSVCVLAFILQFTLLKWLILLLTIGLVVTAEAFNSAMETLVDLVQPEQHPLAKRCKDVSAGAVLIAALISVIIGLLLFVPPLWNLVSLYLE
jgi:diacylglycerol kinase